MCLFFAHKFLPQQTISKSFHLERGAYLKIPSLSLSFFSCTGLVKPNKSLSDRKSFLIKETPPSSPTAKPNSPLFPSLSFSHSAFVFSMCYVLLKCLYADVSFKFLLSAFYISIWLLLSVNWWLGGCSPGVSHLFWYLLFGTKCAQNPLSTFWRLYHVIKFFSPQFPVQKYK